MKNWELENIEITNKNNPNEFSIPSLDERRSQNIGDQVRLHFILKSPSEDEPRAERMWVEITQKSKFLGTIKYSGVLTNEPIYINDLGIGSVIDFSTKHIAQTIIKKGSPAWIDSAEKMALVSKMCFEEGESIRFLYREKSDRDEDSGWRMFTGHESDEYTSNNENVRVMNVGYLLDKDPTLLTPLKNMSDCAFEREDKGKPWVKIEDRQSNE